MLIGLKEILEIAEERNCAIPAFNVYNFEMAYGVMEAAEVRKAPVIFQIYTRMFDDDKGKFLAPTVLEMAHSLSVPATVHLDHGTGIKQIARALRAGFTGIMRDASTLPFADNIKELKGIVNICSQTGVGVEGELGHVGIAKNGDNESCNYTKVEDAVRFVEETGVSTLAVAIGTAHGRYPKAPVLQIERIREIHYATNIPLVMHGGSGVPDEQVRAAINAGIRKCNFSTDLCYAFLDSVNKVSRDIAAVDVYMSDPIVKVCEYAKSRIDLMGAGTV